MTEIGKSNNWRMDKDDKGIVWLTLDKQGSGTNVLSADVVRELDNHLSVLESDVPKALILKSGKRSGFIAGADIKEFTELADPEQAYALIRPAQRILDRLEALPCPSIAMINGFALGGGLELALACHYRVIVDNPKAVLGFPEVKLGIHPGFGGSVRSIRAVGVEAAMDMMLTGRNIRPDRAVRMGLVDRKVPAAELEAAARSLALDPPARRRPGLKARLLSLAPARKIVARALQKRVAARVKRAHYPAPYAIIDLWSRHGGDLEGMYEYEARSIAELFCTPTSRNLVRVFLLQDKLKSLGARVDTPIERVHVVGAGVMGGDIAAWCALRGLTVTLQDRADEYIAPAIDRSKKLFERRIRDEEERARATQRLRPDVEGAGVDEADVVIEAIFEDADAKRELYARVEPRLKPGAILATNTSSIMLEVLSRDLAAPERLVGLHFFNPVAKMPLVEVIRTDGTAAEVVDYALALTRKIDRLPLPCSSAPGFVVNRILMPYLMEAILAAEDRVPYSVIDRAAVDFGMPMGPVELADTVGLDVGLHVARILGDAFAIPVPNRLVEMVEKKQLGRKTGRGFYEYRDGKPVKEPASAADIPPDLTDRLILAMLNEAVAVLREDVVADEDLLDAGVIFGTGFAPFRGGPIHYARERGLAGTYARLEELERSYGERFHPDEGWKRLRESPS